MSRSFKNVSDFVFNLPCVQICIFSYYTQKKNKKKILREFQPVRRTDRSSVARASVAQVVRRPESSSEQRATIALSLSCAFHTALWGESLKGAGLVPSRPFSSLSRFGPTVHEHMTVSLLVRSLLLVAGPLAIQTCTMHSCAIRASRDGVLGCVVG